MAMAVTMAKRLGVEARGAADGRQRRRGRGRLRGAGGHGVLRLHARRHAGRQPVSSAHLCGAKAFLVNGLINDCGKIVREGEGADGLVRPLDAQGAVPPRRQEDDGPGAGRADRLDAAGRDPLSDRRRHGPDRHVEGVRGTRRSSAGSKSDTLPRMVSVPVRRLRPDRAGVRGGRAVRRAVPERRTRSPAACACRRRSATS